MTDQLGPDSLRALSAYYRERDDHGDERLADSLDAYADAWEAEIDRLQAVITAMAEQESADNAALRERLEEAEKVIRLAEGELGIMGEAGMAAWQYLASQPEVTP